MGAEALRFGILLLGCIVALTLQAGASEAPTPYREPNPHPGVLEQPFLAGRDNIRIQLPAGYPLCGLLESYSSLQTFFVPLDPTASCEAFWENWDKWDFVVIDPYLDVPMNMATLDDYIGEQQKFFCFGMRRSPKSDKTWIMSEAPTARAPAGKRLLGLETVTCTRTDTKNDRYSKAYVAYKPGEEGRGYTVAAYVHIKNKEAADRLLERVVDLLKPLE